MTKNKQVGSLHVTLTLELMQCVAWMVEQGHGNRSAQVEAALWHSPLIRQAARACGVRPVKPQARPKQGPVKKD